MKTAREVFSTIEERQMFLAVFIIPYTYTLVDSLSRSAGFILSTAKAIEYLEDMAETFNL